MPDSLPSDAVSSGGQTTSQYFVLSGAGIDNALSGRSHGYRTAFIDVYSDQINEVKHLSIAFVSRNVNFGLPVAAVCDATLDMAYYSSGRTSQPFSQSITNDQSCGSNKIASIPKEAFDSSSEIFEYKANGERVGRKIYHAKVMISLNNTTTKQTSIRINAVESNNARLGYQAGVWNNVYGSGLYRTHNFNFNWRAPCFAQGNANYNVFEWDDGDEGLPRQPYAYDARITYKENGGLETLVSNNFIGPDGASIGGNSDNGLMRRISVSIPNVGGGNGFGIRIPQDSGNYYFKTCPGVSTPTPPTGTIGANCSGVWTTNALGRQFYRIYAYTGPGIAGGTYIADSGNLAWNAAWIFPNPAVTSRLDGATPTYFWYEVWNQKADGSVINYKKDAGTGSVNMDCIDNAPAFNVAANCSTLYVSGFYEPDAGIREGSISGVVYERDGNGNRTGGPLGYFSGTTDAAGNATIPYSAAPGNSNNGYLLEIYGDNYPPSGWGSDAALPAWRIYDNQPTQRCYSATCTISIAATVPGGGAGQVMANANYTVYTTITNTSGGGGKPLPDSVNNSQLVLKANNGNGSFSDIDFLPGGEISSSYARTFESQAPYDKNNYTFSGQASYNGFPLYSDINGSPPQNCAVSYTTYQRYQLNPVSEIVGTEPDNENPNAIEYSINNNRQSGLYSTNRGSVPYDSSTPIGSTSNAKLYYVPYLASGVKAESPPPFDERSYPVRTFGTPYTLGRWDDTLPDVREFNHGGTTGTWKIGDRYCSKYTIEKGMGWLGPDNVPFLPESTIADSACGTVEDRPFVRIYGNDVLGGGNYPDGNVPTGTLGGVNAYSRGRVAPAGSGAEFGAIAINGVKGFTTASLRSIIAAPSPSTGLTFANGSLPGHGIGSQQIADWYSETRVPETAEEATNSLNLATPWDNAKQKWVKPSSGDVVTLSGSDDYSGRRTLYIDGDVVITSNIKFNDTRSSLAEIPSLVIIAKGNISIASGVTRLDGVFIAQPKDSGTRKNNDLKSGILYTCTNSDGKNIDPVSLRTQCNTKLQINGAIIAQSVRFLRTAYTLKDVQVTKASVPATGSPVEYQQETYDNDHAAESIRMTPETYLGQPVFQPKGSQSNGKYDYIVTLPPVLQIYIVLMVY